MSPLFQISRYRVAIFAAVCSATVICLLPSAEAANKTWNNTGTDFNTAGSWSGGVPGTSDVAVFSTAMSKQPNLSASLSIQELNFSTTASSGYDLTSSSTSIKLTLTNTGTGTSSAINAANTSGTNTIDAPIVLGAAAASTQTFTQASGGTLIINGVISSTNTLTLSFAGSGTIRLTGTNTYAGATTILGGIVNIQNASALGTTAAGTTVSSGATLQLQNNITVGAEALTISGTGASGQTGALVNVSGTNNYGGLLTLGAATTISSDSGTLNLTNTGTITGSGFGLTLTGSGSGSVSSIIGTGAGTLTKSGTGTWTLTGADTYTGSTSITAGILNIQNATALGTTASGTTISSGATLQLQGSISVGAEGLTISGTGASGQTGALVNVSGTNNYAGLLSLGAATTISSDSGTLNLTNAGTITGATFGLTLTGSGSGTVSSIIGTTTGSLTKSGSGTWTLGGVNTYTGTTTVNAGTLLVTGSLASGSAVTVNNSGTVLGGTGTIFGSTSIASSGAILKAGTGSTGQTLTMRGAVTMGSGSIIQLALGASSAHSTLAIGAGGSISFQALQIFNIIDLGVTSGSTYSGIITGIGSDPLTEAGWTINNQTWVYNFTYDASNGGEINLNVTAVPEPSTYAGAALALLPIAFDQVRRFKRRRRSIT